MLLKSIAPFHHTPEVEELANQESAAEVKTIEEKHQTPLLDGAQARNQLPSVPTPEKLDNSCSIFKQLLLASQIKDAIYQNQNYSTLLDQIISDSNPPNVRKAVDRLVGIAAINHPNFSLLLNEFSQVSKKIIINSRVQEEQSFFKNILYRLFYKVVFFKKVSGDRSAIEIVVEDIKLALEERDVVRASVAIGKVQSEDAAFLLWREHFKILYSEFKEVNQIIFELTRTGNCSK